MYKKDIIKIIKTLRKEINISQEDIANYIGISRLTYINIENWKRELKENEVKRIADFYEKPMNHFFDEKITNIKNDKNYKLKQLILYISEKTKDIPSFWKTVLNKLLYFSDFNHYEWSNELITWSVYKKLPYWPVPENISEILEQMQINWDIAITERTYHKYNIQRIVPLKKADLSFLEKIDKYSKKEYSHLEWLPTAIEIIDNVLNKFSYWKATEISEWSHKDKPYKSAKKIGDTIKPGLVFYRSESFITNPNNL